MSPTRRPAWLPRLTLRGGAFLAVGGALFIQSMFSGRRDFLFVACLLILVPVTAALFVAVRPVSMSTHRTFRPAVAAAGQASTVSLVVRNLAGRPLYGMRWRDSGSPGIPVPASVALPGLDRFEGGSDNGADAARLEYALVPRQRGVYTSGPLRLERYDPFGLASSEWSVGDARDFVVTPRVTQLPGGGHTSAGGDGEVHERLRHLNHSADELISREYRPGDALRRVNWPATARHGEIMVRQEEQRSNPAARIVFDTALRGRRGSAPGQAGDRRDQGDYPFELAVELVASVGVHLLGAGFLVELVELGPSQLAPGPDRDRGGLRGDPPATFRPAGGARLLLEGLAGIVPSEPGAALAGAGTARAGTYATVGHVPTFAVLVDIDMTDAAGLAALAAHGRPAAAFVTGLTSQEAIQLLGEAGWHCIAVHTARDIPAAWAAATSPRGVVSEPV